MPVFGSGDQVLLLGHDFVHCFVAIALEITTGGARMLLPRFQADPTEIIFTFHTLDVVAA